MATIKLNRKNFMKKMSILYNKLSDENELIISFEDNDYKINELSEKEITEEIKKDAEKTRQKSLSEFVNL